MPRPITKTPKVHFNAYLPVDLLNTLKIIAIKERTTIQEIVRRALTEYVASYKKINQKKIKVKIKTTKKQGEKNDANQRTNNKKI